MKKTLEYLFEHHTLSSDEAQELLTKISEGAFDPIQVASFLSVFRVRGITVEELTGFRNALIDLCQKIDLNEFNPIDLCGTGGDGKDTFNISTLSSLVVAGAGVKVAKHGNYAVSSSCGSSNVMEYLGYHFTNDPDILKKQIDQTGICFLHAPLFHPAMKEVAPIRRSMGVRTFFNMLGPMVNPSMPKLQIVGVFDLELLRFYQYIYQSSNKKYRIIHALDGYDEISLTGKTRVVSESDDKIITPGDFGFEPIEPESIYGGKTVKEAADIFKNILEGKGSPQQNAVVIANSAMAIHCAGKATSLDESIELANQSLLQGKAKNVLQKLIAS